MWLQYVVKQPAIGLSTTSPSIHRGGVGLLQEFVGYSLDVLHNEL
jgi:hypothetical protein